MRTLILAAMIFAGVTGCGKKTEPSGGPVVGNSQKKVWDRDELAALLFGKTPAEVKGLLGTPSGSRGDPDKDRNGDLRFRDKVNNPHTGKADDVTVQFVDQKCTGIKTY